MEIIIPAAIYLVIVSYIIGKLLTSLYSSNKDIIRFSAIAISCIFAVYLGWVLVGFLRDEHGKSFTVGWFALANSFVISFTVLAVVCWILRIVGNRI